MLNGDARMKTLVVATATLTAAALGWAATISLIGSFVHRLLAGLAPLLHLLGLS